jgi:hypothetical protein
MTFKERAEVLLADPLDTIGDTALEWGCSENFIRKLGREGRLQIIKLSPRCQRIRRSEKRRYLASQCVCE